MKVISPGYLRERYQNLHPRTKKAQLNTIQGLLIKGGGMLISLLLVPMTIDYLSKDTYGTWLTISSIITMLMFLDIGIGNGLRNKFSEAVARQDTLLARTYVSTAYAIFGIVQLCMVCIFFIVYRYIPWQRLFNTNIDTIQLQTVIMLTVVGMVIKLVLDILSYILLALQESGRVSLLNFLTNVLVLTGTYTLTRFTSGNLIYLAIISAVSPTIVLLISGFILYRGRLKAYRPTFRLINMNYAGNLLSLGYKFFIIQIAVLILFYTDNLIITQLFGPSEVTTYNIAFRYFNTISTIFAIAVTPYWSAFTEASVKSDTFWMERTFGHLQKIWLVLVVAVVLMVIVANLAYALWIGNRVVIPYLLNVCMGLFIVISCWNSIMTSIVNGLGKIRLQLYYALFAAIINVPLAIFLGRTLHIGSAGVILATSISLLIGTIFGTIQARKIIFGTATGIWNR